MNRREEERLQNRRMWMTDAQVILGITFRQVQYWIRRYIPPPQNYERRWGHPAVVFRDVFQLAFLAEARRQGYSIQKASKRLGELRKFLRVGSLGRKWILPRIVLLVFPEGMVAVQGSHRVQHKPPVVVVDGPALYAKIRAHFLTRKGRGKRDLCTGGTGLHDLDADPSDPPEKARRAAARRRLRVLEIPGPDVESAHQSSVPEGQGADPLIREAATHATLAEED